MTNTVRYVQIIDVVVKHRWKHCTICADNWCSC